MLQDPHTGRRLDAPSNQELDPKDTPLLPCTPEQASVGCSVYIDMKSKQNPGVGTLRRGTVVVQCGKQIHVRVEGEREAFCAARSQLAPRSKHAPAFTDPLGVIREAPKSDEPQGAAAGEDGEKAAINPEVAAPALSSVCTPNLHMASPQLTAQHSKRKNSLLPGARLLSD